MNRGLERWRRTGTDEWAGAPALVAPRHSDPPGPPWSPRQCWSSVPSSRRVRRWRGPQWRAVHGRPRNRPGASRRTPPPLHYLSAPDEQQCPPAIDVDGRASAGWPVTSGQTHRPGCWLIHPHQPNGIATGAAMHWRITLLVKSGIMWGSVVVDRRPGADAGNRPMAIVQACLARLCSPRPATATRSVDAMEAVLVVIGMKCRLALTYKEVDARVLTLVNVTGDYRRGEFILPLLRGAGLSVSRRRCGIQIRKR